MKSLIFTLSFLLLCIPLACLAKKDASDIHTDDIFKIKFVNAPNQKIRINGIQKQATDTLRADAKISWENAGDYIRAENLRTNLDYKITAHDCRRFGAITLANYIHKRYTGSKGSKEDSAFEAEGKYLTNFPWELVDGEVEIPINLHIDDYNFYVLQSIPNDSLIIAEIDCEDSRIYVTQKSLTDKGIQPKDIHNYSFRVLYIHDNTSTTLTDNLTIEYIPTSNYSQE